MGCTFRWVILWSGRLKCLWMYVLCFVIMEERCWLILTRSAEVVQPIYCFLHFEQVIKYTT